MSSFITEQEVEKYFLYLDERIKNKKIDTLTNEQKNNLIKAFQEFPINCVFRTSQGEEIYFSTPENITLQNYIHHFLIKYNKNKDYFSKRYLELLNIIQETIYNYTDRILGIQNGNNRIYYIKEINNLAKRPIHIVVVDAGTVLRAWTHFECKKGYLKSLLKTESELIKLNILINTEGKEVKVQDYNEYNLLKRKTLLYLGSNALSEA